MEGIVSKKDLKKLKHLSEFLSEKNETQVFAESVLDFIQNSYQRYFAGQMIGSINQLQTGEKEWFGELIAAVINSSLTVADLNRVVEDLFGEGEDLSAKINVHAGPVRGSSLPNGKFKFDLRFQDLEKSTNIDAINRLLNTLHSGGEFIKEEEDSEEKKTYYFNAKRGFVETLQVEEIVSNSLNSYFAKNTDKINKELDGRFKQWMKEKGIT